MPEAEDAPTALPVPPAPPVPTATFAIMTLGQRIRRDADTALRHHSLSLRHLSALGHLHHQPGLSYSELGRRADVTAQSMQATLAHLEERGAVERRTPAGRGRTAQLHVTDEGVTLMRLGEQLVEEAGEQVLADLTPEQRAAVTKLLLPAVVAAVRRR